MITLLCSALVIRGFQGVGALGKKHVLLPILFQSIDV